LKSLHRIARPSYGASRVNYKIIVKNKTQRRIHKYFFSHYFSAKFHPRECGNQQYTK
jgi:hypothetical protein